MFSVNDSLETKQSTITNLKSVNLQYNTLGCLDDGTNESSTKSLMFQAENKLKGFLQRILQEIMKRKKKNWNIRRLVNNSFVPSSKQPSVLYCKLTDFCTLLE